MNSRKLFTFLTVLFGGALLAHGLAIPSSEACADTDFDQGNPRWYPRRTRLTFSQTVLIALPKSNAAECPLNDAPVSKFSVSALCMHTIAANLTLE